MDISKVKEEFFNRFGRTGFREEREEVWEFFTRHRYLQSRQAEYAKLKNPPQEVKPALPSDEEIEKKADEYYLSGSDFEPELIALRRALVYGAKWMRGLSEKEEKTG